MEAQPHQKYDLCALIAQLNRRGLVVVSLARRDRLGIRRGRRVIRVRRARCREYIVSAVRETSIRVATEVMMTRRTKQSDDEIVEEFYGINSSTFEVEQVWLTRGGMLSKFTKDGVLFQHAIAPGRQARAEVIIVFNLIEIFNVHPQIENQDDTNRRIGELKVKAAQMKADAAKE